MAATRKFPLEMVHDGIKGTATAHSESSYKVLAKNGWRPKTSEPAPAEAPTPDSITKSPAKDDGNPAS